MRRASVIVCSYQRNNRPEMAFQSRPPGGFVVKRSVGWNAPSAERRQRYSSSIGMRMPRSWATSIARS